jgi:hypothetical protein
MKRMIESITGNYSASASVVDGTLIISLPNAISPVVWRLDLGQARASALEVRAHEDGTYTLLLKTPRGDVNDIAKFDAKAQAVSALMAVSGAMKQAHGQVKSVANDSSAHSANLPVPVKATSKPGRSGKNFIAPLIALSLIILLLVAIMNMGPVPNVQPGLPGDMAASQAPTESGVPLSADDFLKNQ